MNKAQSLTASQILMTYDEAQLKDIFEKYGQVRNAITLAQEIIQSRSIKALKCSQDLNEILEKIKFGSFESYAAPVYQALRIEVNDELGSLARSLPTWVDLLSPKGRLSIITFHSLEDRIVKDFFSQSKVAHQEDPNYLLFGQKPKTPWKIITKKPISPSYEEVATNSRSRSAKIRTIEKI
jgi:16S rRNA (cytosine1402-N4)-methyltransferase